MPENDSKDIVVRRESGIVFNKRGAFIPDNVTLEQVDETLWFIEDSMAIFRWARMDLLMAARDRFGEDHAVLLDSSRYAYRTITNLARIWHRFPTQESRKWDLYPSHYRSVCADWLSDEERAMLLDECVEAGMGSDEFSRHVQDYKEQRDGKENEGQIVFSPREFAIHVRSLASWARSNNAPADLLGIIEPLIDRYERMYLS